MACELVNYYNCQIFNFTHHYTMIMITLHPTSSGTVVIQCTHLIFLRLTFLRMTHPTMMRAVAMTTYWYSYTTRQPCKTSKTIISKHSFCVKLIACTCEPVNLRKMCAIAHLANCTGTVYIYF